MLEFAFRAAGGMAIQIVTNQTVQRTVKDSYTAISEYFSYLLSAPDIFKEVRVGLDQQHFEQLAEAIGTYDPTSGVNPSISSYTLEAIAQKLAPETLNNRYKASSHLSGTRIDSKQTFSLASWIINSSKNFITRADTTLGQRKLYIEEMNKIVSALKKTTFLLSDKDLEILDDIRSLTGNDKLFDKLNTNEKFDPVKPSLITKDPRFLNNERFCSLFQAFESLDFKTSELPLVPGKYTSSIGRPNVIEYINSLHPDTANNKYFVKVDSHDYPCTILTASLLMAYTLLKEGNKTQLQAKCIHSIISKMVDACILKGVVSSDLDDRLLGRINSQLEKFTDVRPPMSISLQKDEVADNLEANSLLASTLPSKLDNPTLSNSSTIAGIAMREVETVAEIKVSAEVEKKALNSQHNKHEDKSKGSKGK